MKLSDIPLFTRSAAYQVNVPWDYLEETLERHVNSGLYKFNLDPDFQRAHVWTVEKQIKYVEFVLRGGKSSRDIYWNCPGWMSSFKGPLELVDGKQRIEAVLRFLRNEIPAFGFRLFEYEDHCSLSVCDFIFYVNDLNTRKEVLQWYLDLNEGGVIHTIQELDKVKKLLEKENDK